MTHQQLLLLLIHQVSPNCQQHDEIIGVLWYNIFYARFREKSIKITRLIAQLHFYDFYFVLRVNVYLSVQISKIYNVSLHKAIPNNLRKYVNDRFAIMQYYSSIAETNLRLAC